MTTATMQGDRSSGMWEVTTRVIVYAAIGAALYGVAAIFSFLIPGTANVSVRPAFALVTFFGFAFGPIVGFFTGCVGNAIADQLSGWGLLTSWNWSRANGLAGLLAVVIGFLFVFTDIWLGTADDASVAFTANYLPVVIANLIASVILTPILVAVWDPIQEAMGR